MFLEQGFFISVHANGNSILMTYHCLEYVVRRRAVAQRDYETTSVTV